MPTGTSMPAIPASIGNASRRRSRSSPMSNSRRSSNPTTRKKNVMRPLLTQNRRSCATRQSPNWTEKEVLHSDSYDDVCRLAHTRAANAAITTTRAPPVSVCRKARSGALKRPSQVVRSDHPRRGLLLVTG